MKTHFVAADHQRLGTSGRAPTGTLHGVEPGAEETLCGVPAAHLAWFEDIEFDDVKLTRCRRCAKSVRREHRDQRRDAA